MNPTVHTAEVLPPRALVFLGIVALHVVLVYFLANGMIRATIHFLAPPMKVEMVPEEHKPQLPTPIVDPTLVGPSQIDVVVPDLDVRFDLPWDPDTTLVTIPEVGPTTSTSAITPQAEPIRLVGRNSLPNTEDYYPVNLRRERVEGATDVRACVNEKGRLEGTPTVERSSGTAGLDNAAIRVARDGRYARSVQGDRPVPNCHRFRIIFMLD